MLPGIGAQLARSQLRRLDPGVRAPSARQCTTSSSIHRSGREYTKGSSRRMGKMFFRTSDAPGSGHPALKSGSLGAVRWVSPWRPRPEPAIFAIKKYGETYCVILLHLAHLIWRRAQIRKVVFSETGRCRPADNERKSCARRRLGSLFVVPSSPLSSSAPYGPCNAPSRDLLGQRRG